MLEGKDEEAAKILYSVRLCCEHTIRDLETKVTELSTKVTETETEIVSHKFKITTHETELNVHKEEARVAVHTLNSKADEKVTEEKTYITENKKLVAQYDHA